MAERRPLTVEAPGGHPLLLDPAAAPRLARTDPHAEVRLVLADPVEHYLAALAERRVRRDRAGGTIHMADVAQACRLGSQLRHLHAFLGPDRVHVEQRASGGAPTAEPWPALLDALAALLAPEVELLRLLAPGIDVGRWTATGRLLGDRAMLRPA